MRIFSQLIQLIFRKLIGLVSLLLFRKSDSTLPVITRFAIGLGLSAALVITLNFNFDLRGWFSSFSTNNIKIDNRSFHDNSRYNSPNINGNCNSTGTGTVNCNSNNLYNQPDLPPTNSSGTLPFPRSGNPPTSDPRSPLPPDKTDVVPTPSSSRNSSSNPGGSPQNSGGQPSSSQSDDPKNWDSSDRNPSASDRDRSSSPPSQDRSQKEQAPPKESMSMTVDIDTTVPEPSYEVGGIATLAFMILFAWRSQKS